MTCFALRAEISPQTSTDAKAPAPQKATSLKDRCQACFPWFKSLAWAIYQYFCGKNEKTEDEEDLSVRPSIKDLWEKEPSQQITTLQSLILNWDGGNGNQALAHHFGLKAPLAKRDTLNFEAFVARLKAQLSGLAKQGILSQTDRVVISDLFSTPAFRTSLEQYFGPPRKAPPAIPVNPVTGFPLPASPIVDPRLQRLLR